MNLRGVKSFDVGYPELDETSYVNSAQTRK